jgi:hypothetical protein
VSFAWTAKAAVAPAKLTEFLGKMEIKKRPTSRRIEDLPHLYLVSTVAKELWEVKRVFARVAGQFPVIRRIRSWQITATQIGSKDYFRVADHPPKIVEEFPKYIKRIEILTAKPSAYIDLPHLWT